MRSITSPEHRQQGGTPLPRFRGSSRPSPRQLSSDAARDARNEAQRRPSEAPRLVRMPDIAAQQPADDAEHARRASGPEAHRGVAVERALGRPRGAGVVVERLRERRRVAAPRSPARMASAASRAEVNASYMPSPESGSTSPAASPTRTTLSRAGVVAPTRRIGSRWPRTSVSTSGIDPVGAREPREVVAQVRPFLGPSRRRRDSRGRPSGTASRSPRPAAPSSTTAVDAKRSRSRCSQPTLPSSATPRTMPSSSPTAFATTPFAPSAPTSVSAATSISAHRRRDPLGADLERVDAGAVPEGRAGRGCLLGEVRVEPPPLRHQDQRLARGAPEAAPVVEPQLEGVDDALDDRRHVARRLLERAAGEPAAARLVAREARPVGEQHALAAAGEMDRRRRAGRAGTDDEDVEALHHAGERIRTSEG